MANRTSMERFPSLSPVQDEDLLRQSPSRSESPYVGVGLSSGTPSERWRPRRSSTVQWADTATQPQITRHGRQKSLSEALRTIRTRRGSMSQNAHEIADALKAPISTKLVLLCGFWYLTSIMSNTSSKAILTAFPKPITLTIVQFAFVSSWCIFLAWLARLYPRLRLIMPALKYGIRPPSRDLIATTLPLTLFQIGGHILSSDAMSRIPISLVHTIKGLSPLLTVFAYRTFLGIEYSLATYLSLVPLTLGVVMACSANFSANFMGLVTAFGSAVLFVTQNIVSKKIFTEAAIAEADGGAARLRKPDKLNLLCYSSGLAFLLTAPIWLWSEGLGLLGDFLQDASVSLSEKPGSFDHGRLAVEFVFNGSFHFGQNMVAFVLLSMVSPVTYSVASLIKRVFVITFAVVWFGNAVTAVQATGIALTFVGLYLYDRISDADKADRRARLLAAKDAGSLLPLTEEAKPRPDQSLSSSSSHPAHHRSMSPQKFPNAGSFAFPSAANGSAVAGAVYPDEKRNGSVGPGLRHDSGGPGWLPSAAVAG